RRVPDDDVAAALDVVAGEAAAGGVPEPDAVPAADVGQILADDRRAVDEAAVALGDEDAEQRVLDPRVDDAHVGRVVDAGAGILGGVRVAASPDGQAAHLHAGSGDAEHGALTVAVEHGAGVPHEVDRALEEDVLVMNARGHHDRVTVAGASNRRGD